MRSGFLLPRGTVFLSRCFVGTRQQEINPNPEASSDNPARFCAPSGEPLQRPVGWRFSIFAKRGGSAAPQAISKTLRAQRAGFVAELPSRIARGAPDPPIPTSAFRRSVIVVPRSYRLAIIRFRAISPARLLGSGFPEKKPIFFSLPPCKIEGIHRASPAF